MSSVAAPADVVGIELLDELEHDVRDGQPQEDVQQYERAQVEVAAIVGALLHRGLILTLCVAVQISWVGLLCYAALRLAQ
jgi:hypothetical protein